MPTKVAPSLVFVKIYEELSRRFRLNLSDSTLSQAELSKLFIIDSTVFSLFKAILKTSGRASGDGKKKGACFLKNSSKTLPCSTL